MRKSLVEGTANRLDKLNHTLIVHHCTQGKRIDKHAHGIANAQIGTAIANRCDAKLLILALHISRAVGETGQGIEHSRQGEMGRCHVVMTTELFGSLEMQRARCFTNDALLNGIGQI